jgi:flagellar export protein FliJ
VPVSDSLRRLLRIRDLEEEQGKIALESAVADLHRLEGALRAARDRERAGRKRIAESARSGDATDRMAGMVEISAARRHIVALKPRIAAAEWAAAERREEFLGKRTERRQADTLIVEAEAADVVVEGRRSQQSLDDWYGMRMHADEDGERRR